MLDIKEYLKQTRTVLVTQDAFDELVKKASVQPDIIHCGECKYYHDSDGCFFSTATTGADGFCHWAERKDGETDGRPD